MTSAIFYLGVKRPQSTKNDHLLGQKKHFLKAYSLVSSDTPNTKDVHMKLQTYSPVKRGLFCVK